LNQYEAVSMAVNSRLFTVDELTSQRLWNSRQNPAADHQYAEAQQIVQLLRDELGIAGEIEILRLLGAGYTFDEAYQAMPRRIPTDFASTVAARIRASATAPGIAFAPDSAAGTGANGPTFVLYGYAPNAVLTLSIRGAATGFTNSSAFQVVDQYGVYWSRLGTSWPPDTYTFTITTNTGQTVTKSVTKAP